MCGVVSIVYGNHNDHLGKEAGFLLKKLEYRGYDSTGAAVIRDDGSIVLRKKVGAPSKVVEKLEINKLSGTRFIGQVRWATYGSVTDNNAQPHEMNCMVHMVGAHNGNISNTDTLKEFLSNNGHQVKSDNDGEMLVHVVEHFYYQLTREKKDLSCDEKITYMKQAVRKTQHKVTGSYAACVTLPDIDGVFAIKAGSSLYAGKGSDRNGDFIVVSSDLTSVLAKTRFLIPLVEGEGLYFNSADYLVFSLKEDKESTPQLTRSRLNIADIALQPKYHFFMEQEIHSSPRNTDSLIRYYFPQEDEKLYHEVFEADVDSCRETLYALLKLYDVFDNSDLRAAFEEVVNKPEFVKIKEKVLEKTGEVPFSEFVSEETTLLEDILAIDETFFQTLHILDRMLVWKKKRMIIQYKYKLIDLIKNRNKEGGRIFVVASGTSYHASLVAGYFFNHLAHISIIPANPGMFRSVYMSSLNKRDVVIGVSQSGETKDLVDIFNDITADHGNKVTLLSLVNNENSTLPQEKSDFYLPVMCGPEIAVAATKSFISQIALFYILAASVKEEEMKIVVQMEKIKYFMDFTIKNLDVQISEIALNLFMKPSLHILGTSLIGLAKEGALKVREVVLNHTEGYDSAEFKHGPNTILGKNTIYSLTDMEALHDDIIESFEHLVKDGFLSKDRSNEEVLDYLNMIKNFKFRHVKEQAVVKPFMSEKEKQVSKDAYERYSETVSLENYFDNYPLIFICPPDERDKRITISQIHTHKIRGADIILIAEEDEDLQKAALGKPAGFDNYFARYIPVPKTGNKHIFVFQAALILELLSLKMSIAKMKYLNKMKIENHGVHPDVPKNVSKSITVD